MSLTINGATNTLTAASGLTIAGNTAVTGTLSATGKASAASMRVTGTFVDDVAGSMALDDAAGAGGRVIAQGPNAGTQGAFYVTTTLGDGTSPVTVATFSSTGLAVTGTLSSTGSMSVVPTTGTNPAWLFFNNDSGAANSYIGQDGSVAGLDTAYSLNVWNGSNTPIIFGVNNAKVGSWTSTGLAVTGTLSATGLLSGTAGVQFRGADATSYELLRVVGAGANNPGLFVKATEATKTVELFQSGSAGGEILVVGGIATYTSTALTLGSGVNLVTANDVIMGKTITAPGTTGAQTINKTSGRVNFAAAATSLVVTNSLVTANSICHVTKATNDATMRLGACVAAAGSITIYADVAPAAETAVNFTVTN